MLTFPDDCRTNISLSITGASIITPVSQTLLKCSSESMPYRIPRVPWLLALNFYLNTHLLCHSTPQIRQTTLLWISQIPVCTQFLVCLLRIDNGSSPKYSFRVEKNAFIHLDSTSFCLSSR